MTANNLFDWDRDLGEYTPIATVAEAKQRGISLAEIADETAKITRRDWIRWGREGTPPDNLESGILDALRRANVAYYDNHTTDAHDLASVALRRAAVAGCLHDPISWRDYEDDEQESMLYPYGTTMCALSSSDASPEAVVVWTPANVYRIGVGIAPSWATLNTSATDNIDPEFWSAIHDALNDWHNNRGDWSDTIADDDPNAQ